MTYNELMALDQGEVQGKADKKEKAALSRPVTSTAPRTPKPKAKPPERKVAASKDKGIQPGPLPSPALVERLRKAVKAGGKEAATHRFTAQEKAKIADVVYTYGREGYRTSENEIVRIGANWLLEDYRAHGQGSVLHRVLRALKA